MTIEHKNKGDREMNKSLNELVREYVENINTLEQMQRELREQGAALQEQLRHVRGTKELEIVNQAATLKTRTKDLATTALYKDVLQLLTKEPCRFSRLLELTGASQNALTAVLARLQRDGTAINLGNRQRALWFIPREDLKRLIAKS